MYLSPPGIPWHSRVGDKTALPGNFSTRSYWTYIILVSWTPPELYV